VARNNGYVQDYQLRSVRRCWSWRSL